MNSTPARLRCCIVDRRSLTLHRPPPRSRAPPLAYIELATRTKRAPNGQHAPARLQAKEALGQLAGALADVNLILHVEPKNKDAVYHAA